MRRHLAESSILAATLLIGSSAALSAPATCIKGSDLQDQPPGDDGSTFGQQYFRYDPTGDTVPLVKSALADRQMYLWHPSGRWIYGEDWCFETADNTVRLLRSPLRTYDFGGEPGAEIGRDDVIWIGYVPAG